MLSTSAASNQIIFNSPKWFNNKLLKILNINLFKLNLSSAYVCDSIKFPSFLMTNDKTTRKMHPNRPNTSYIPGHLLLFHFWKKCVYKLITFHLSLYSKSFLFFSIPNPLKILFPIYFGPGKTSLLAQWPITHMTAVRQPKIYTDLIKAL